jgi:gag-polyprotein putative aspartyl protease
MMAARRKRVAGKPPEEKRASSSKEKGVEKQKSKEAIVEDTQEKEDKIVPVEEGSEFPFKEKEIPIEEEKSVEKGNLGFHNRAPLQADERAKELLKNTLQHPITLTAEDLLNVSEPMRMELKKLLTKKRLEKKSVHFSGDTSGIDGPWRNVSSPSVKGKVTTLPDATCEILKEDKDGLRKGDIVIGDPVSQYLATLRPGEKPKPIVVARESQGLRAIYPLINTVGVTESLLDSGSQIISMSKKVADELGVKWNSEFTIEMESANRSLESTLGLAKNVPFSCGAITVYLQVHIMSNPAYKVLLGRPFDIVTESLVKNDKDGGQTLTLTDPNSGERCVMVTYERGKPPDILKKPVKEDFQNALRKQC